MLEIVADEDPVVNQKVRAELRAGFLKSIHEIQGKQCSILTYEKSTLQATFSVWKPDGSNILVNDLKTPARIKMPAAILRSTDILAITFDDHV